MSNLFLFTGENHQALQEKLKFWEKAFIEKHSDNNLEVFDDVQQGDLSRIINAVDSQPFLAEKRMIIIKGLPQGADVKKKIELESLEPLLEKDNIPESSVVIFVSPRPDKRSRFFKLLSKAAQVETFELPKGAALRQWVQQRLAAQEKKITPQAIDLLLLFCAEDVNRMASEIEKLGLLQRDLIDEEAIELIVSPNPEAKIFKALDQIGKQSLSEVLKSFEELVRGGEEVMLIFFMIVRQFRLLIQIRSLLDRRSPQGLIQKRLKLAPFQVAMLEKQASTQSLDTMKKAYRQLVEIDWQLKTGRIPTSVGHEELFVLKIDQFLCSLYE